MDKYKLFFGDCLKLLSGLADKSVDAVITDLPYGTTAGDWDKIIPPDFLWKQYERLIKHKGVFITTASQPFSSLLVTSKLEWFRYEWVWEKNFVSGMSFSEYQPMRNHENVLVFYKDSGGIYNPQLQRSISNAAVTMARRGVIVKRGKSKSNHIKGMKFEETPFQEFVKPKTILRFNGVPRQHLKHPTQKPLELYEYLIKTYTNAGGVVLDFCMGSGTTGEACMMLGRRFIGIEKEKEYFDIAEKRIKKASLNTPMFTDV